MQLRESRGSPDPLPVLIVLCSDQRSPPLDSADPTGRKIPYVPETQGTAFYRGSQQCAGRESWGSADSDVPVMVRLGTESQ